ncbi:PE-PPE domain-containing protein [Streptomyces sp. AJS327]|uniref:PE-PPE domain-containing protein n=1 Tax=Streptomyces sp. AJS327 TaxID=2545265 RepID=UPI0015DFCF6E|nr:PE-PPE domain-containing protein [Streptomyces sp. AJS327]MBA0051670.1 PE-PPE domain-containing protein [Streptomyces sp. AJS327]
MRRRTLIAVPTTVMALGMVLGGGAVAAPAKGGGAERAGACPEKMIFEVGGHRDGNATAYDASNARLPAGVQFTKIKYSASIAPFPGDTISKDDSVREGIEKLDREVRGFHGACPGSRITITGYSQGAIVAGDELHRLSQENTIPHDLINGVLYGDPRRPGVNGGPGGIEGNLPTIIPGLSMNGPRGFGDLRVQEICKKNDGICHSENPITNLLGFANGVAGYFMGDHGYDIEPNAENGSGDRLIDQPPRVPHGPPLPIPVATPWKQFNGDLPTARREMGAYRDGLVNALPKELRERMAEFPWMSVPAS